MTDDELTALNACSIPHFVIGLDRFNGICAENPQSKTYLECYRAFIESDDYKEFLEFSQSGSGNAQYSADNVNIRQSTFDYFIDKFTGVEANTDDVDIVEDVKPNITQIKNVAVIHAEFVDSNKASGID